jgi:hypothetical protein
MTNAGGAVTSDQFHPLSHPTPHLAPQPPQRQDPPMPPTPSPTDERLRAPARLHREAHTHEPRLPTPDADGAPRPPQPGPSAVT